MNLREKKTDVDFSEHKHLVEIYKNDLVLGSIIILLIGLFFISVFYFIGKEIIKEIKQRKK